MSDEIKEQDAQSKPVVETPETLTIKPEAPDFSKMSADELKTFAETALETKRSANEEAKGYRLQLEARDATIQKAKDDKLKEQNEYKELFEKEVKIREGLELKIKQNTIKSSLITEATKQGIVDVDGIGFIKVPDDFEEKDAKRLVTDLKKSKTYLFTEVKPSKTNSPTNTQPSVDQDADLRSFDVRLGESMRKK